MEGQTIRGSGQNDRETIMKTYKEYENIDKVCEEVIFEHELEGIQEAEYQGKKVKLNDPIRGGSKKFYVYVKNDKGNVQKVEFGSSMPDAMGDSEAHRKRRKNYGIRHKCSEKDDKTAPGYWSCRATKHFGRSISGWW